MLRFFRRQRPAPQPRLTVSEALTASAWGLDESGWLRAADKDRGHMRDNLVHAPNFKP